MGKRVDIPENTRMELLQWLLGSCNKGRLKLLGDSMSAGSLGAKFGNLQKNKWLEMRLLMFLQKEKVESKPKYEINYAQIQQIEHEKRGTIQSISDALGIPKSIVGRWAKAHLLRPHTNAIMPLLTDPNKLSRPVFDENGICVFDGKIGVWPFVEEVTAQRNNIKRNRGTKEIKPIQSINRQVIKENIIKQIIPAIKQKWPTFLSKNIQIQQDNARPHIQNSDADFQQVANVDGFHIELIQQPPNSPDCNVLDLGFHTVIQCLQQRQRCKNADELIQAVKDSFQKIEPMTLNKVFLTLQCVFQEILKYKGHNNFKQPHMKKDSLLRQGILPRNLEIPMYLVRECVDFLIGEQCTDGIEELLQAMDIIVPHNGEGILDLNF